MRNVNGLSDLQVKQEQALAYVYALEVLSGVDGSDSELGRVTARLLKVQLGSLIVIAEHFQHLLKNDLLPFGEATLAKLTLMFDTLGMYVPPTTNDEQDGE